MTLDVVDLRCEHAESSLGIDVPRPRLGWRMAYRARPVDQPDPQPLALTPVPAPAHGQEESGHEPSASLPGATAEAPPPRRGARQAAYQIRAAATPAGLAAGDLLWDSGRVESDVSAYVAYGGPPLRSGQRVYWQVQIWDDLGATAASAPAWWEMGLLERGDWQGRWIGAPFLGGPRTTSPAPYLRTTFMIERPVESARLYVSALGLAEPYLNGERVGADVFLPGWTDYQQRVQYHVYDVTDRLQQGANALGAILGDGWYCGFVAWRGRQVYGDRPKLLAQLQIRYADGSNSLVASAGDWRVASGPILESDMLMGESYDARRELGGWCDPAYDDRGWLPVATFPDPGVALSALCGPPVRRHEELAPVTIRPIPDWADTKWIFDLGQNMVGWVRLRVRGPAGSTVTLRYAEALSPDGTLYTENLRSARCTDHYTLRGDGEEIWEPRFTFHGFRYVELAGLAGTPDATTITGVVLHSAMARTGDFRCSDELVNQLQRNIVWGQRGNFVDVPTDCPQRDERLGWTGDAQVFVQTAAYTYDVAGFFTRWLRDVADAQGADGRVPAVVPHLGGMPDDGGPAWADAAVICPWEIYCATGDRRVLEDRYPLMRRFVDYLAATSRDGLRCYPAFTGYHGFGDWLALDGGQGRRGRTSRELIGTAYFAHSARLFARVAAALGRQDDAERYGALFEAVRAAFQRRYVTGAGLVAGETQTGYVLALHCDLLPEALRPAAAAELARLIRQNGDRLSTGFVSTHWLPLVLSAHGYTDLAYALLLQRRWPSWLYPVTQGATTIWERWDGWTEEQGFQTPSMNSFNHYAYGAIGAWLYTTVAGIAADPEAPGYQRMILRPQPGGGLAHAEGRLETRYGPVLSRWELEGGRLRWDVQIPPNTSAIAVIPARADEPISEGAGPLGEAEGVAVVGRDGAGATVRLVAGHYRFVVG